MSSPLTGNVSGVYAIRNVKTDGLYVGSTTSLRRRKSEHFRWLRQGRHHSPHLQHSWNAYGGEFFQFEVLELCPVSQLQEREQHHLDILQPVYNSLKAAGAAPRGVICGEAVREAVRRHATGNTYRAGKTHTEETKELLRQRATGKVATDESRAKVSLSLKGHAVSDATRAATAKRNSERIWTQEDRIRHSEAKKAAVTPEFRQKQSVNATGKIPTEETRKRMSASQAGRVHSSETKERMSLARKAYWERRRLEKAGLHAD